MVNDPEKLVIEGEFPGLNKIIDAAKSHYQAYRRMKQDNTNAVAWPAKKLPVYEAVELEVTWYCKNRRRDPDNIAAAIKFIFDGLVEAGRLKNDGWKENKGWTNKFKVDKENPRVEIVIKEVG
jgi:Holliday junction resolvase RusA-like endonuclease